MPEVTLRTRGRATFRHAGVVFDGIFRVYDLTDDQLARIRPYIGRFLQRKPVEGAVVEEPAKPRRGRPRKT